MTTIKSKLCQKESLVSEFGFSINNNNITNLDVISNTLVGCGNLKKITLNAAQPQTKQYTYQFLNVFKANNTVESISVDNGQQCELNKGQFVTVSESLTSYSCGRCYGYCSRCSGTGDKECFSCKNNFLLSAPDKNCSYGWPSVQQGQLNLTLNSIGLVDSELSTFMDQFHDYYVIQLDKILQLSFDLSGNKIIDYSMLNILQACVNMKTLSLVIHPDAKTSYKFLQAYNNLMQLQTFSLDNNQCVIENQYIQVTDEQPNQWNCSKCPQLCQRCKGNQGQNCTQCYSNQLKLQSEQCVFDFKPISSQILVGNFSNDNLDNAQFNHLISELSLYYQQQKDDVKTIQLDFTNNLISDIQTIQTLTMFSNVEQMYVYVQPSSSLDYSSMQHFNDDLMLLKRITVNDF